MQHRIPTSKLGPRGEAMAEAVGACVHCGFCLPTCPTYRTLGEEMDSPRGRIVLMKGMLEGDLELEEGLPFVDRCLGCLACVTACPSGVEYGELVTSFRAHAETTRRRPLPERLVRAGLLELLSRPRLLRLASRFSGLGRLLAPVLPRSLRAALDLAPRALPRAELLPERIAPEGAPRARVALLLGCAQEALAPGIARAAARVLSRRGVEVLVPAGQGCCGALALHTGDETRARRLATRLLDAMPRDVDAVITTAAGCGSGLADYPLLLRGGSEEARGVQLAERATDIATYLDGLGASLATRAETEGESSREPVVAVYQDACHLAHAQGERDAPRRLLEAAGLELREAREWQTCCGSAGLYNLEQPEIAEQLGRRKAEVLAATGARLVVSGNIGCMTQLERHLRLIGSPLPVLHTVEVLDLVDRGELPRFLAGRD